MSTILVVDDTEHIREPIAHVLWSAKYRTVCAVSGEEALDVVRRQVVDLIVLDLFMPGIGGLGFLKALRSIPSCASTPVILLTAAVGSPEIQEAEQYGVQGYLLKTHFSLKELVAKVQLRLQPEDPTKTKSATDAAA